MIIIKNICFYEQFKVMDTQIDIHKQFVYMILNYAIKTDYKCYVLFDRIKHFKVYEKQGFIKKMEENGIEIIKLFLSENVVQTGPIRKIKKSFIEMLMQYNFNYLFIFAMFQLTTKNSINSILNVLKNEGQIDTNFNSAIYNAYPFLIIDTIDYLNNNLKIRQLIIDQLDPNINEAMDLKSTNVKSFAIYEDKTRNIKHLPFEEIFLYKNSKKLKPVKSIKFVFGYQVCFKERLWLYNFVSKNIERNKDFLIYEYIKSKKIKTSIPQDEYLKQLEACEFSLVGKANSQVDFSASRFHECVSRKCIPILLHDSNYKKCLDNEAALFFENNGLIYDISKGNFNQFVNSLDYSKLIEGIYSLNFIKKYVNKKVCYSKEFLENLLK